MAHELEFVDGKAQMAFAGHLPWHGLGTQVDPNLTPKEMQQAAGVDWEVHKIPLTADFGNLSFGDTEQKIDTGHSALVRDLDFKVLDVVPSTWNPVSNDEAFEFFKEFVDAGQMEMHTAGSLKGGTIVWALAKLKEGFTIFSGDEVEGYLLFSNPWQFGRCVDIKFTPIRVVCNNTLTYALGEVSDNQVRHSHRSVFDAARVKQTMGMSRDRMAKYKEKAEFLGGKRYTEELAKDYFNRVFPVLTTKRESRKDLSKQATRALELAEIQPGADFAPGSMWNLFNAATYITNHEYGRTTDSRLTSLWFGQNASRNRKALDVAIEMADAL